MISVYQKFLNTYRHHALLELFYNVNYSTTTKNVINSLIGNYCVGMIILNLISIKKLITRHIQILDMSLPERNEKEVSTQSVADLSLFNLMQTKFFVFFIPI